MINSISLNEEYSTTKLLTKEKPEIVNNLEDKFETVLFLPEGENKKGEGGLRTKGYFKKSYEDKPLISIVTVVYNGEKYLEETIQSVINQTYDNVEYIIIDGGSKDGTVNIIKKYEERIDYWVSEKDKGISDAFNKGILCSTGKYHLLLNSDDYYLLNCIELLVSEIKPNIEVICANAKVIDTKGNLNKIYRSVPSNITSKMSLVHNTCLISKITWIDMGQYSLSRKIAMDHELILKIYQKYGLKSFIHIDKVVSVYRLGGISDSLIINGFKEVRQNIKEILNKKLRADFSFLVLLLKFYIRKYLLK